MFKLLSFRTACWTSVLLVIAGCSSPKQAVYDHEHFDDAGTFSRSYPASDDSSCEAGRRALLSQGYIITSNDPKMISGRKSFQQTGETHIEISFNLVCAADVGGGGSTMFANALQDRYALKKTNNSASLGVGVLGSVSMPIGSTDDSMVKVASETVASAKFYERFFGLVENFLPPEVKQAAHIVEKPKADLGVPEAASAPAPAPVPAPAPLAPQPVEAEPKAETVPPESPATPVSSEPVAAPAEPAAFSAEDQ
ncbi:lipoprotein [Pseudomonas cichorii]|nr:lipoprotein [Pseudomonas cichorii]